MKFNCEDNQTVELKIHNYEFPDSIDCKYDGNWLNIYLKVESKVGHWQTIDPSLVTWEVIALINWFRSLANNDNTITKEQEFSEPNISFYLLNNLTDQEKIIKIKFDFESRPKPAKEEIEYSVVFIADKIELDRIAYELETELQKFPARN
jgi:hypothetical protein